MEIRLEYFLYVFKIFIFFIVYSHLITNPFTPLTNVSMDLIFIRLFLSKSYFINLSNSIVFQNMLREIRNSIKILELDNLIRKGIKQACSSNTKIRSASNWASNLSSESNWADARLVGNLRYARKIQLTQTNRGY